MNGPYDGTLTKYYFGADLHARAISPFEVEAMTLAQAIRSFRLGAEFPHQYSTDPIAERRLGRDGYDKTFYLNSRPGAVVVVYVLDNGERREVARIPVEDEEQEDFGPALLPVPTDFQDDTASVPVGQSTSTELPALQRKDIETRILELEAKMGALAQQRQVLMAEAEAMRAELKQRLERVWMIELFLGSKERVKCIATGQPAPAGEPITVRQMVLCMDEEMAYYEWLHHPEKIGQFDWRHTDDFDQWLIEDPKHLEEVFPYQKGIVGLRVRRHHKHRPEYEGSLAGAFMEAEERQRDQMTCLLVRNGENLYRLWADINIWPRFVPNQADLEPLINAKWESDRREAQDKMKTHIAGLLVIQGLIERSDLFHPLPITGLSVFKAEHQEHFRVIYDAEGHKALADGTDPLAHVTWSSYRKWLQDQLAPGMRVLWAGPAHDSQYDKLAYRTGVRSAWQWPLPGEIYVLDKVAGEHSHYDFEFLYLPADEIWNPNTYEYRKRTRRLRISCYRDEILPVDLLSWRVLEHLLTDRNQREDYNAFFQIAWDWWHKKKEEEALEEPFVDLVIRQAGAAPEDREARARCHRLIRWWKLKTKVHRALTDDEPKALRMITKAFAAGKDYDDPEQHLPKDLL